MTSLPRWASFRRIVPWMGGHKATVQVTTEGPSRLSLWVDDEFVPIVEADGHPTRCGYVIFSGPFDDTLVFDFYLDLAKQGGHSRFVCRIEDLDIVDRIADLATTAFSVENPIHDGEPQGHTESR